jgi:5-methylthioadenosine/S-adenosylhomocysteine deaminase
MRLLPDLVYVDGRLQQGIAVSLSEGRITSVAPPGEARDLMRLPGKALLPGTVNAHCHTFQSLLRGPGDDLDFMAWRGRVLYPFSTRLDRESIYLGAAFAFAEILLHGATTCVDFFGNASSR